MPKTKINTVNGDWTNVKNKCRLTNNKKETDYTPNSDFKLRLLVSEHSPIRLLSIDWSWENIPYWVSTEWSRHKWEKFITTQRTERTGINRNGKRQDAPVHFSGIANAQHLIDTWRKRLCFKAATETRMLAEDFKVVLHKIEPELALVLVPNCIYRCGCPEMKTCDQRFFQQFIKSHPNIDVACIADRYRAYQEDILIHRGK